MKRERRDETKKQVLRFFQRGASLRHVSRRVTHGKSTGRHAPGPANMMQSLCRDLYGARLGARPWEMLAFGGPRARAAGSPTRPLLHAPTTTRRRHLCARGKASVRLPRFCPTSHPRVTRAFRAISLDWPRGDPLRRSRCTGEKRRQRSLDDDDAEMAAAISVVALRARARAALCFTANPRPDSTFLHARPVYNKPYKLSGGAAGANGRQAGC